MHSRAPGATDQTTMEEQSVCTYTRNNHAEYAECCRRIARTVALHVHGRTWLAMAMLPFQGVIQCAQSVAPLTTDRETKACTWLRYKASAPQRDEISQDVGYILERLLSGYLWPALLIAVNCKHQQSNSFIFMQHVSRLRNITVCGAKRDRWLATVTTDTTTIHHAKN